MRGEKDGVDELMEKILDIIWAENAPFLESLIAIEKASMALKTSGQAYLHKTRMEIIEKKTTDQF